MKKMILVLMMVFGLSAAFAKPVDFESGDYYIITNDENEQTDFSGMSDLDIVARTVFAMPKKTGEYKNVYGDIMIDEVSELSKRYFNYFMFSKDETHFILVQNLGDGRELMICFELVK